MRRRPMLAAALALTALLALACGSGDEAPASDAPAPDTAERTPPAEPAPPPAAEPEAPAEAPAPAPAGGGGRYACIDGRVEEGAAHYATLCASCHGAGGKGDGPAAASLDPAPASHADGNYMNALSNEHVFTVIRDGGAAVGKSASMAPWGGALSDDQIRDVVAYVRSLAEPPYSCP